MFITLTYLLSLKCGLIIIITLTYYYSYYYLDFTMRLYIAKALKKNYNIDLYITLKY